MRSVTAATSLFTQLGVTGKATLGNACHENIAGILGELGATHLNLGIPEARSLNTLHPFKGNLDPSALAQYLSSQENEVAAGFISISSPVGGGQPVSLENLAEVSNLFRAFGIPVVLDGRNFDENIWMLQQRSSRCRDESLLHITAELFSEADAMLFCLGPETTGNGGAFLAVNSDELAEQIRDHVINTEGFTPNAGMNPGVLEALIRELEAKLEAKWLRYRSEAVTRLAKQLVDAEIRIFQPPGGSSILVDASSFYPHLRPDDFPAQVLICELYLSGGIRAIEHGSIRFGTHASGAEISAEHELVNLNLPLRTYTQSHFDYIADVLIEMKGRSSEALGLQIVHQPQRMRHFTAQFAPNL
jgi:tryptophanase